MAQARLSLVLVGGVSLSCKGKGTHDLTSISAADDDFYLPLARGHAETTG
jgi:hypothetical protein